MWMWELKCLQTAICRQHGAPPMAKHTRITSNAQPYAPPPTAARVSASYAAALTRVGHVIAPLPVELAQHTRLLNVQSWESDCRTKAGTATQQAAAPPQEADHDASAAHTVGRNGKRSKLARASSVTVAATT